MTKKTRLKPDVVRGGRAIPIKGKTNYYYMQGRKHRDGGIDIGKNPRTGIEVEDGEVMHITNNNVEIFSAVPFLNGKSPAQRVIEGDNPTTVFRAQENYKDRNKLNDDGSKKKKNGGKEKASTLSKVKQIQNYNTYVAQDFWRNPNSLYVLGTTDDKKKLGGRKRIDGERGEDKQTKDKSKLIDKIDKAASIAEKGLALADSFTTASALAAPNPYTIGAAGITSTLGSGIDAYQIIRAIQKGDRAGVIKNGLELALSLTGAKLAYNAAKHLKRSKTLSNTPGRATSSEWFDEWEKANDNILKAQMVTLGNTVSNLSPSGDGSSKSDFTKQDTNRPTISPDYDFVDFDPMEHIDLKNNAKQNKKRMGGLSRKRDYGSSKKPYPKVKSSDFAGGNRSYPIPTKADAVDALRLAGLHGRSDVKAKVYRKYPELRKKARNGGIYSTNIGGKVSLHMIPSTGKRTNSRPKAALGKVAEFLKNNAGNAISLASNVTGSILGYNRNKDMLNSLKYSPRPVAQSAAKLKTRVNINPQLDQMRETVAAYERDVNRNTASSRSALARKQAARLSGMNQVNQLYANKENTETELINKDRLNRQSVANANVQAYNTWREGKTAFENSIAERKSENELSLLNNINAGVQDIITRNEKKNSEDKTIAAMAFGNANLPIELFYEQGIVNKRVRDAWIKAYRNGNSQ